jgi:DNA repair protein RecO (recombination protein O)
MKKIKVSQSYKTRQRGFDASEYQKKSRKSLGAWKTQRPGLKNLLSLKSSSCQVPEPTTIIKAAHRDSISCAFTIMSPPSPMAQATYNTQAICLKSSAYRESDRIVVFYSPDYGRISAIAKGIKKQNSKLAGACEPLMVSDLHLMKGQSLETLFQYQALQGFDPIRQDMTKLAAASVLLEMVYRVATEHDANSLLIYDTLLEALQDLAVSPENSLMGVLCKGQLKLLEAEGYGLTAEVCVHCAEPLQLERSVYRFSIEQGGPICAQCDADTHHWHQVVPISASTLSAFNAALASLFDSTPDDSKPDPAFGNPQKVQRFIQYYYQQKLEKPLKSATFLLNLLTPDQNTSPIE